MRNVVVHYHLFKNAGTSLDDALRQAVGERWTNVEADVGPLTPEKLANLIERHPNHAVFSSHTATFPVPALEGCAVFPIVFVRHPIDRARSVYQFEHKQEASTASAIAAKNMSFRQYVEWRLEIPGDRQLRNFQVVRCSAVPPQRANLETATTLLSTLPFVGLVEDFDLSIAVLTKSLQVVFPGINLAGRHANRTQDQSKTLEERVADIQRELGPDLYGQLIAANQDDLALFDIIRDRYTEIRNHRSVDFSDIQTVLKL